MFIFAKRNSGSVNGRTKITAVHRAVLEWSGGERERCKT